MASQAEQERAIELARKELKLTPEKSLDKESIEASYKMAVQKLERLKLNAEERAENQVELTRSRDILLLNQRQTRMAINQQTVQEEDQLDRLVTMQDNLGRQMMIDMPTATNRNDLPPNGVVLLPKSQGPGKNAAMDDKLKTMSEEVLEKIANQMKLPSPLQLDMKGPRPSFTSAKKLDDIQQQQIQKEFSIQMAMRLKEMQLQAAQREKAGLQQKQQMQPKPELQKKPEAISSIRSPFATTPKPPVTS